MNFDDHEIWGAPVRASEAAPEAPAADATPAPAEAGESGRLYRSAGSDPHPEAIVALPNHRRHTHPTEATKWATPAAPSSPITINSRIPRPAPVDDAAIAEVLATPAAPSAIAGFTSWFKQSSPVSAMRESSASIASATPAAAGSPALGALVALSGRAFDARMFAALVFVVTALVGVVNAVVSTTLGIPTGIALVAAAAFGAWRIDAASRWAAWVMPAYSLIAALLIAGQFTSGAPGVSPLGQLLLIATELITLAPWLGVATVIGVAVPALRGRTA